MADVSALQEAILKAVDTVVAQRNKELKLDKTVVGTISKNVGKKAGKPLYEVKYNGGIIYAVSQSNEDTYASFTPVYILVPEGNFSNDKIIIGRATSIDPTLSGTTVAAAINQYALMGSNLLGLKSGKGEYGLHSYHGKEADNLTEHSIEHRAQFLYRNPKSAGYNEETEKNKYSITFDDNSLEMYAQETNNILLRADFRTNLSAEQKIQPSARYGLIFNFAMYNLNYGYGETNGEILSSIGEIVQLSNEDSLKKLVEELEGVFNPSQDSLENDSLENDWAAAESGIIDITLNKIIALYSSFQEKYPEADITIVQETVRAYEELLRALLQEAGGNDVILNKYNTWKSEIVSSSETYIEQYVLSSDNMLGNPLNFNNWNSQYSIFNIPNLQQVAYLDSILFYKEGFIEDVESEGKWPLSAWGPDIFVKNIRMYAVSKIDDSNGEYTLKVEPASGCTTILSNDQNGDSKTTMQASLWRKFKENLSSDGTTIFRWFKEDSGITSASSIGYHYAAGLGWRQLDYIGSSFATTIEDNPAYKNNYKCVVFYGAADTEIILSFPFSIYNRDMSLDVELESDLGTVFSFGAGVPTIIAKIKENRMKEDVAIEKEFDGEVGENGEEISLATYHYSWAIEDDANGYLMFLDDPSSIETDNPLIYSQRKNQLDKIKKGYLKDGEVVPTDNPALASRINYPVYISSRKFTVTCYLKKRNNGVYQTVGSATLTCSNDPDSVTSDYRINILNGQQVFQYDEYGISPTTEKNKSPLEIAALEAQLFSPTGVLISANNYDVEWIYPISDSLIIPPDELTLNPASSLIQSARGQKTTFTIEDVYNPDCYNNQITCHVSFSGRDFYQDTEFYFTKQGGNGTNGTDVVTKIVFDSNNSDNETILRNEPLTLIIQKLNTDVAESSAQAHWNSRKTLSDTVLLRREPTKEGEKIGPLRVIAYQKGKLIEEELFMTGYPFWGFSGKQVKEIEDFSITNNRTIQWKWKDSGINEDQRVQLFRAETRLKDRDTTYYCVFSLPIITYEEDYRADDWLEKNKVGIAKKEWLQEVVYNQDGRNPVYNHNQGLKLYNLPSMVKKIVWEARSQDPTGPSFSLLETREDLASEKTQKRIETTIKDGQIEAMVYVLPNDEYDGSVTTNIIKAELYADEDKLICTVRAPLYFSLNRYGLASVNAWDGNTVTIDEDNGYVLAPQIGAGEKNEDNLFTGILMGKTETYAGWSEKEKQIGLFGYSKGLQSIFLDAETGNAIFGLPDVTEDEEGNYSYHIKDTTKTRPVNGDNYNEGRIELIPGDTSSIGGWRLGRRSLYYTMRLNTSDPENPTSERTAIGEPYHLDYAPNAAGEIVQYGNNSIYGESPYSRHHEKDIAETDSGVLIHSGTNPYISLKGRVFTDADFDPETGILPLTSKSQLQSGDSLEVQLDPMSPTLFTIFRHNGKERRRYDPEKETDVIAYEKDSRTFLAGINGKGELQANSIGITLPPTLDGGSSGAVTTASVAAISAFEDSANVPTHIGYHIDAGNYTLGQFFVANDSKNGWAPTGSNSTLHISGGGTPDEGEYARSIAMHGKGIGLYAKDDKSKDFLIPARTTINKLELSQESAVLAHGLSSLSLYNQTSKVEEIDGEKVTVEVRSTLDTNGSLEINAGHKVDKTYEEIYFYANENNYIKVSELPTRRYYKINANIGRDDQNQTITKEIYAIKENTDWNIGERYYWNGSFFVQLIGESGGNYYSYKENNTGPLKYMTLSEYNNNRCYKLKSPIDGISYISENDFLTSRYTKEGNEIYTPVNSAAAIDPSTQYVRIGKEDSINDNWAIPVTDVETEDSEIRYYYAFNGDYYSRTDENSYYYYEDKNNPKYISTSEIDTAKQYFHDDNSGQYIEVDAADNSTIFYKINRWEDTAGSPSPYTKFAGSVGYVTQAEAKSSIKYIWKTTTTQETVIDDSGETTTIDVISEDWWRATEAEDTEENQDVLGIESAYAQQKVFLRDIDTTYNYVKVGNSFVKTESLKTRYYQYNGDYIQINNISDTYVKTIKRTPSDVFSEEYLLENTYEEMRNLGNIYIRLTKLVNNVRFWSTYDVDLETTYKNDSTNEDIPQYEESNDTSATLYYITYINKSGASNFYYLKINDNFSPIENGSLLSYVATTQDDETEYVLQSWINTSDTYVQAEGKYVLASQIESYFQAFDETDETYYVLTDNLEDIQKVIYFRYDGIYYNENILTADAVKEGEGEPPIKRVVEIQAVNPDHDLFIDTKFLTATFGESEKRGSVLIGKGEKRPYFSMVFNKHDIVLETKEDKGATISLSTPTHLLNLKKEHNFKTFYLTHDDDNSTTWKSDIALMKKPDSISYGFFLSNQSTPLMGLRAHNLEADIDERIIMTTRSTNGYAVNPQILLRAKSNKSSNDKKNIVGSTFEMYSISESANNTTPIFSIGADTGEGFVRLQRQFDKNRVFYNFNVHASETIGGGLKISNLWGYSNYALMVEEGGAQIYGGIRLENAKGQKKANGLANIEFSYIKAASSEKVNNKTIGYTKSNATLENVIQDIYNKIAILTDHYNKHTHKFQKTVTKDVSYPATQTRTLDKVSYGKKMAQVIYTSGNDMTVNMSNSPGSAYISQYDETRNNLVQVSGAGKVRNVLGVDYITVAGKSISVGGGVIKDVPFTVDETIGIQSGKVTF